MIARNSKIVILFQTVKEANQIKIFLHASKKKYALFQENAYTIYAKYKFYIFSYSNNSKLLKIIS